MKVIVLADEELQASRQEMLLVAKGLRISIESADRRFNLRTFSVDLLHGMAPTSFLFWRLQEEPSGFLSLNRVMNLDRLALSPSLQLSLYIFPQCTCLFLVQKV